MAKQPRVNSAKIRRLPGQQLHHQARPTSDLQITIFNYDPGQLHESQVDSIAACLPFRDKAGVTWINFDRLGRLEPLKQLAEQFGLHPLVMEDILDTSQRPKLEDYDHYLYFVLKMLSYDAENKEVKAEQLSLVLSQNVVLSFQEDKTGDVFDPLREALRQNRGLLRRSGADFLLYALVDAVIDHYFNILEQIGTSIEELEQTLIENPMPATLQTIYQLKRELIFVHNAVWPLREVLSILSRNESPLFKPTTLPYLRDIYDHTVQVIDLTEIYREITTGMIDLYLSSINNRTNNIMKFLTIIATIFIPLTFITSIYGMNFDYMPELHTRWGYPVLLAIMGLISLGMIIYLRRKNWL
jgi:magnesium transporter